MRNQREGEEEEEGKKGEKNNRREEKKHQRFVCVCLYALCCGDCVAKWFRMLDCYSKGHRFKSHLLTLEKVFLFSPLGTQVK